MASGLKSAENSRGPCLGDEGHFTLSRAEFPRADIERLAAEDRANRRRADWKGDADAFSTCGFRELAVAATACDADDKYSDCEPAGGFHIASGARAARRSRSANDRACSRGAEHRRRVEHVPAAPAGAARACRARRDALAEIRLSDPASARRSSVRRSGSEASASPPLLRHSFLGSFFSSRLSASRRLFRLLRLAYCLARAAWLRRAQARRAAPLQCGSDLRLGDFGHWFSTASAPLLSTSGVGALSGCVLRPATARKNPWRDDANRHRVHGG